MSLIEAVILETTGTAIDGIGAEDRWYKVLCPFHADSKPSAGINPVAGAFICRACFVKGDCISLIRQFDEDRLIEKGGNTFGNAQCRLAEIASEYGLEVSEPTKRRQRRGGIRPRVSEVTGSSTGNNRRIRPRFGE